MLPQSKNNSKRHLLIAISTEIASRTCAAIILLTLFSMGLGSCSTNASSTTTGTSISTTTSAKLFTQWESKTLAPDALLGNAVAGIINGKSYLICSAYLGSSPNQENVTIVILDITNPENPKEISSLQTEQDTRPFIYNLKLNGSTLYVLTYDNLWIMDVSHPNQPKNVGQMPLIGANSIEVSGKYAYIISVSETNVTTISTVDISDPVHPVNVGQTTMSGSYAEFYGMEPSSSLLFVLAENGLYVYDISTPASLKQIGFLANPFPPPTTMATFFIPQYFFDMAPRGNFIYITAGIDQLLVVDISDPSAPKIVNDFTTTKQGTTIIISGETAYLLSHDGPVAFSTGSDSLLTAVDITDPGNPEELSTVPLPGPASAIMWESYGDMTEANNHLYFFDNRYPIIQVIDLGNLTDALK